MPYDLLWCVTFPSHLSDLLYNRVFCQKTNLYYGPIIGGQVNVVLNKNVTSILDRIDKRPVEVKSKLTKTELKMINFISEGYTNKEVAKKLTISEKTVKAHLTNIFIKLNLKNRYQLIVYSQQINQKQQLATN